MKTTRARIYDFLFVLVLVAAAWFRLVGVNWDNNQHLHPDERFLTMVETDTSPVQSLQDYFNTDTSTLNPNNVGHGFYVYGDLPIIMVRYVADWMSSISGGAQHYVEVFGAETLPGKFFAWLAQKSNWAGYDEVALLGRVFSTLVDLGAIFLLYVVAARIYGRKVALLGAAFSAVAVMQIQQSHFFTTDNFLTFFMMLATYFAAEVAFGRMGVESWESDEQAEEPAVVKDEAASPEGEEPAQDSGPSAQDHLTAILRSPLFWNVIGFGVALGMAMASKINAAPLAIMLPVALLVRYFRQRSADNIEAEADAAPTVAETDQAATTVPEQEPVSVQAAPARKTLKRTPLSVELALVLLVLGGILSFTSFRIFQPYAFKGPYFLTFDFSQVDLNPDNPEWFDSVKNALNPLNPKWVSNIMEQQGQTGGDADSPPALQWARRSKLYSIQNMVQWGMGWPLGILACLGFLYMGWRILSGEWKQHLLLWSWTGLFVLWQSVQGNPNMRYELPVYPLLAIIAAWLAVRAFEPKPRPAPVLDEAGEPLAEPLSPWAQLSSAVARILPYALPVVGILVLVATAAYAYAFVHIYMVDHSRVQASKWIYQNVPGPFNLEISQPDGTVYNQPMPYQTGQVITPTSPYDVQFTARADGVLQGIVLGRAMDPVGVGQQTLTVDFSLDPHQPAEAPAARATLTADLAPKTDPRGESYTLKFDKQVTLKKDQNYFLHFETSGALTMIGSAPISETEWDDGLPLRMDGYDGYGGIYQGDRNFQMYWDDDSAKLERFTSNLDSGDYVFITSNRQWATTTRIPERYPLTIVFYRNLIGCPADKDVIWCYNVATPGMFTEATLGYELIQVFESFPTLGPWRANDQFADESFTVYDHPKVLIFKKRADYDSARVHAILGAVDLSKIVRLTPYRAAAYKDLMLPADRLAAQQAGGTWSDLFSYETIQNKYPFVGLVIWYLAISLLGLVAYLLLRPIFPGLSDRAYPLARLAGLLLLAYFSWLIASVGGTYSRLTIAIVAALIVVAGLVVGWLKREEVVQEIRSKGGYFLGVEALFLALFLIDLLIRIGNPDLWHPWKGGERPMDFAFLNAVLKSTSFPPYDPWFAGGYINYYYWGYILVGTPIKLLGIVPSIAYNFVLPTLFAVLGMGGFSVAWNLVEGLKLKLAPEPPAEPVTPAEAPAEGESVGTPVMPQKEATFFNLQWLAGIAAAAGLVLIGNLGTVQTIYQNLQKMGVGNELFQSPDVWITERWLWAAQGVGKLFAGEMLPIPPGDWYWNPSRVIPSGPGNEITEFPLFTFLYSDLHAHMISLPLTVLAIAWVLSVLTARNMGRWAWLGSLLFGGVVIGALRPTNTWDFPTYLVLGALVTGYAIFRYANVGETVRFGMPPTFQRVLLALAGMGLLVGASVLFYQPFSNWYALGYSSFHPWEQSKTPIWSYLTHWGVFLFVIISWMTWETRQWLAQTPLSALEKLQPYLFLIQVSLILAVFATVGVSILLKAALAWLIMPLAFWALILILRPGLPDTKRLVLFMIGTALAITLAVEIIVLDGDIGRQNTIFKFYMQGWVLLAISSAAAIAWMVSEFHQWSTGWRTFWYVVGGAFLAGALLFTFTATIDKIKDRIAPNIPLTLDSMTYMQYSTFSDDGQNLDLNQDYKAIRWMQDNIKGSPVVLDGVPAGIQYAWYSRISIYTGLPAVVGWQWHEEQQRTVLPDGTVAARGQEAQGIYRTMDIEQVKSFLKKYAVRYIIVGQLERLHFPEGLDKFEQQNGILWKDVYREGDTVIYEVLQ